MKIKLKTTYSNQQKAVCDLEAKVFGKVQNYMYFIDNKFIIMIIIIDRVKETNTLVRASPCNGIGESFIDGFINDYIIRLERSVRKQFEYILYFNIYD